MRVCLNVLLVASYRLVSGPEGLASKTQLNITDNETKRCDAIYNSFMDLVSGDVYIYICHIYYIVMPNII